MDFLLDIMRDGLWQFIGVVLSIIAIAIAITQRKRKVLNYVINSDSFLFDDIAKSEGFKYKDKSLKNPRHVVVKIINSGNIPILRHDFESSISIDFGSGSEIVNASLIESKPKDIQVELGFEGNCLSVRPSLLNKTDWFNLSVLLSQPNKKQNITFQGRIIGVKRISKSFLESKFSIPEFLDDIILLLVSWVAIGYTIFLASYPIVIGTQIKGTYVLAVFLGIASILHAAEYTSVNARLEKLFSPTLSSILKVLLGAVFATAFAILALIIANPD